MAAISLSGFGNDTDGFSIGRTITLNAWESATDPTNNGSTVSWQLTLETTNSRWYACYIYAKVGDTVVYTNSDTSANGAFPSVADSRSGSFSVTHNSGGDKTLSLYLEAWVYWHTAKSTSGSLGLTNFANSWGSPSISVSSTSKTSGGRGSSDGLVAFSLSRSGGSYCSVSSYSITCNGATVSNTSPATFTGLKNNTTYNWSASIKNNRNKTGSNSGSFYLTPVAPAAPTLSCATGMYDAGFTPSTSYDTLRKFSKWNISYGKTESYGNTLTSTSSSGFTIPDLEPGTTYYYSISVTDQNNGGAYSTALTSASTTGSFTTEISPPTNLRMSVSNVSHNSFMVNYSADTLEDLPITNYDIYYMHGSSPNWEDIDAGYRYIKGEGTLTDMQNWLLDALGNQNGTVDIADLSATANYIADDITHVVGDLDGNTYINNLSADSEYLFYFTATNAQGTTKSSYYRFATALGVPTLTRLDITELTPFGFSIECEAAAEGTYGDWLKYRFSIDNGNTWTNWLADDSGIVSYTWGDLQPETTYNMIVHVKAEGNYAEATTERFYTNITTPADQAKVRIRTKAESGYPVFEGYTPVQCITATALNQRIELNHQEFFNYEVTLKLKWNDVTTEQNIGSNIGGYFGVSNGYYTSEGVQTATRAVVGREDTVRLVSEFLYDLNEGKEPSDPSFIVGGSRYYQTTLYVNGSAIDSYETVSSSSMPSYKHFHLFGVYGIDNGSTASIYSYSDPYMTLLPYVAADGTPVFISQDGEVYRFDGEPGEAGAGFEAWLKGKTYYKLNGSWVKAKKIYKKIEGQWIIGTNN